jgi:hypothetical protein
VCEGVAGGAILDPVAALKEERAQPTILALIVLDVVTGFARFRRVLGHDVVVHQTFAAEEREASGTAEDAANHVLGSLLKPMTDGVFEHLIPGHQTCCVIFNCIKLLK